jgi:hypothetical protein
MSVRAGAAVGLLFLSALGSHALLWSDLPWRAAPEDDETGRAERRLTGLRDQLPARGAVGYRTEPPVADPEAARNRWHRAQYVLAPVVVEPGDQLPEVVDAESGARVRRTGGP